MEPRWKVTASAHVPVLDVTVTCLRAAPQKLSDVVAQHRVTTKQLFNVLH